mmetsp:Transcript_33853/g.91630  ORF Transcript_33853/g.91630 Transcript_33853/m.91630 type:complete len:91 (-) Transcript_33853:39-311(-)
MHEAGGCWKKHQAKPALFGPDGPGERAFQALREQVQQAAPCMLPLSVGGGRGVAVTALLTKFIQDCLLGGAGEHPISDCNNCSTGDYLYM